MIPILKERVYENNAISFKTVGFLADAHNCQVTEERNGIFEMSFNYLVESMMFQYLREDLLVLAKPNDTDNDQMFRIYEITKPINGVVTVNCEHISYELQNYPIKNAALHSITPHAMIQSLIDLAKNNVSGQNSNINLYHAQSSGRTVTSSLDLPLSTVRSALGGIDGSVLDLFGGEYKFDNFDIYLPTERGSDNGVIVAYRKNLTDVKLTTSMESSYTGLFPYVLKDDVYTFLSSTQYPTGSISVTNNSGIAERILMRDFTSEFGDNEEITPAALLAKAQAFLNKNDINALTASMSVSFVNLWQSEEYKDYAPLEKVGLCDTVTVYHEKLGINLKLKVIKTVYDPVSERYIKIELGSPKSDFAATIAQQQKQVNEAVKIARSTGYSQITAEYQQAIADATAKITGNSGGHVRFTLSANGEPEEITIMNTGDTSTATQCWRWNLSGLGYSSTGYSGSYTTAITPDGKINADFIRTGTMSAERIRTGILASANGSTYFDLTNSEIVCDNTIYARLAIKSGELRLWRDVTSSGDYSNICESYVGGLTTGWGRSNEKWLEVNFGGFDSGDKGVVFSSVYDHYITFGNVNLYKYDVLRINPHFFQSCLETNTDNQTTATFGLTHYLKVPKDNDSAAYYFSRIGVAENNSNNPYPTVIIDTGNGDSDDSKYSFFRMKYGYTDTSRKCVLRLEEYASENNTSKWKGSVDLGFNVGITKENKMMTVNANLTVPNGYSIYFYSAEGTLYSLQNVLKNAGLIN